MITAIVLINVARTRVNEVAETLGRIDGVSEVYSVGGRFDLVAIIRVGDHDALAEVVTSRIAQVDGIERTETLIAYRSLSRHDLESMFSVGMQES